MRPREISNLVKRLGRELGFNGVGITLAGPAKYGEYYKHWLAAGYAGAMAYLHRNQELRLDPRKLLPGARSIICVTLSYHRPEPVPKTADPAGRVAQYAQGRDYHGILRGRLEQLALQLAAHGAPPFQHRVCVDTAPVLERELAIQAGLGWIGKNTCLIHPRLGSFLFLGEMLTTLDIEPDAPETDHCGTCTRCIDACPTDALLESHTLDSNRCVAYLTIEHRGEIPTELQPGIGDWVYGCDICQEVCPFNRHAPAATDPDTLRTELPARVDLLNLLNQSPAENRRMTQNSAASRARPAQWRRNAAIALSNVAAKSASEPSADVAL